MKDYIFFVYTDSNPYKNFSTEKQQQHIQKVSQYIHSLAQEHTLKAANPLEPQGIRISGTTAAFQEEVLNTEKNYIGGYYLIAADSMEEAVSIAKSDPRFEDKGWQIEIRPIQKIEGIN